MHEPLISFVIPFYNRYTLLKTAVRSVLDSPFKDVEIILIDDASDTCGFVEFLRFISQSKNITYIRQEKILGAARRLAIRLNGLFGKRTDIYPEYTLLNLPRMNIAPLNTE
jgi:glycosyltransferase involved in cell wall biosynthesis